MSISASAPGPMDLALGAARRAGDAGEVPVGAVVIDANGGVLAIRGNRMRADRDPSAHAEMLAMREAARGFPDGRLIGCDLWVTLEPCPMCATAAGLFRVRKLVFGAYDSKGGGVEHGPRIFSTVSSIHKPEILAGVQEIDAQNLLRAFFSELRNAP